MRHTCRIQFWDRMLMIISRVNHSRILSLKHILQEEWGHFLNKLGTKTLTKRDSEVSWGHMSLGNRDRLGTKIGTPERHKDTI